MRSPVNANSDGWLTATPDPIPPVGGACAGGGTIATTGEPEPTGVEATGAGEGVGGDTPTGGEALPADV